MALAAALALALVACGVERERGEAPSPTFEGEVAAIFEARCVECHGEEEAAGGFRADTYLGAIACTETGEPLVADGGAPLLEVLGGARHEAILTAQEREVVGRWLAAGAPARRGFVHPTGIVDPRSPDWHGLRASEDGFRLMLDDTAEDFCGKCHQGGPWGTDPGFVPLQGATSCRSCHGEPDGVLACGTCHGSGADPLPPRDPCFFPEGPAPGAHRAHLDEETLASSAFDCETCHPAVEPPIFSGAHGDGDVDVVLPGAEPWAEASWDPESASCAGGCHSGDGDVQGFDWYREEPLECGSCHGSPPDGHNPRPCTDCHAGVAPNGAALTTTAEHIDGQVDLRGRGQECGACHGSEGQPWPDSGAHTAHRSPTWSEPIPCESCHVVPDDVDAPGHIDDTSAAAEVTFGGLALAGDASPTWEGGRCADTPCHDRGGAQDPTPAWEAESLAGEPCGSCHGSPPAPPHPESPQCGSRLCHGGEVALTGEGPRISPSGRVQHVDGDVDVGGRP